MQLTGRLLSPRKECLFAPQPSNTSFLFAPDFACTLARVLKLLLIVVYSQAGREKNLFSVLDFALFGENSSERGQLGTWATQGMHGMVEVVPQGAASVL